MNFKTLRPIAATLLVASLAPAVNAETLRDHPADAQAQAAALLNPPAPIGAPTVIVTVDPPELDAQASAAALLSGTVIRLANTETQQSDERTAGDAQAHAAALLAGSTAGADSRRTPASSSAVGS